MFGLSKLWSIVIAALLGGVLLCGSFAGGYHYGKSGQVVKHEKQEVKEYKSAVATALKVADAFAKIGVDTARELAKIEFKTQERVRVMTEYVYLNPPPAVCELPADFIELRNQQIDDIWRAAGWDLPDHRRGKPAAPAVRDVAPAGTDRRR